VSLDLLAKRLGIATTYTSAWGEQVVVPEATILTIIASFGYDTSAPEWQTALLAQLDRDEATRVIEPVLVAWDGIFDAAGAFARCRELGYAVHAHAEDGSEATHLVHSGAPLPHGYYDVRVGEGVARSVLVSAPTRIGPPTERRLCVFAPLYALRSDDPARFADLRELEQLVDWVADNGGDGVLTLPLLASFLDDPVEYSPYAPVSRSMWNELYAVIERPSVSTGGTFVDYAAAYGATRAGIEEVARSLDRDPFQASAFLQFLASHPRVGEYARFRAAGAKFGRAWLDWPEPMRSGELRAADVDGTVVRFHCVAQWLMHTQLEELSQRASTRGIALGLDLAVGTHRDAFDVWTDQHIYAFGSSVGAPPDTFFPGGQAWGFPPPIPNRAREDGYRQFRDALRHHLTIASLLRVDHVMGLLRLFWVPEGTSPEHGTYVYAQLDEQLAVLCLEAHRAGATIVGENLGVVPPEIDAALATHGLLGITIGYGMLEDEARAAKPLDAPGVDVATFGTHDMATFAGFVHGDDLTDRIALGFGDPDEAREIGVRRVAALAIAAAARGIEPTAAALFGAASRELAASAAPWVALQLEDLWGERAPQNVPGTSAQRPNWLRRAAFALADAPPEAAALLRDVAEQRKGDVAEQR
jgi:4-alpha-glucanotransferase